jgi:hypothetical protein
MTKEQFLNGTIFKIEGSTYKGACTYSYSQDGDTGCILKQSRSSIDERVVLNDYECNVPKITKSGFIGFTYIIKKKVVVKYKFTDLVEFKEVVLPS